MPSASKGSPEAHSARSGSFGHSAAAARPAIVEAVVKEVGITMCSASMKVIAMNKAAMIHSGSSAAISSSRKGPRFRAERRNPQIAVNSSAVSNSTAK